MIYALALTALIAAYLLYRRFRPLTNEGDRWSVIEHVRGKEIAHGVELIKRGDLWSLTVEPGDELDGVTKPRGALSGAIGIEYRITGGKLYPSERYTADPILSVYIQRAGDDWLASQKTASHRWYTTEPLPLTEGTHKAVIPFKAEHWHNTRGQRPEDAFLAALRSKGRIGLAFGHWDGRMHGVRSTTPVTFELLAFEVV